MKLIENNWFSYIYKLYIYTTGSSHHSVQNIGISTWSLRKNGSSQGLVIFWKNWFFCRWDWWRNSPKLVWTTSAAFVGWTHNLYYQIPNHYTKSVVRCSSGFLLSWIRWKEIGVSDITYDDNILAVVSETRQSCFRQLLTKATWWLLEEMHEVISLCFGSEPVFHLLLTGAVVPDR